MKIFNFPAGETGVQLEEHERFTSLIDSREFNNGLDLMGIAQAKALTRATCLYLPYIPYARQDRDMKQEAGMTNALKQYGILLNSLGFSIVKCFDPHSDVAESCIDNLTIMNPKHFLLDAVEEKTHIHMVVPDAGAAKKATATAKLLFDAGNITTTLYQAIKHRDLSTGDLKIEGILKVQQLLKDDDLVYVFDDICDGGRTFIELARHLNPFVRPERLNLVVTHGIFSNGLDELMMHYAHIYTTNSFRAELDIKPEYTDRFHVYPV